MNADCCSLAFATPQEQPAGNSQGGRSARGFARPGGSPAPSSRCGLPWPAVGRWPSGSRWLVPADPTRSCAFGW